MAFKRYICQKNITTKLMLALIMMFHLTACVMVIGGHGNNIENRPDIKAKLHQEDKLLKR